MTDDQRERAIQATMALLPTHENLRRPWASQIVEAVQRALAQSDEVPATIEALRQGMAELGFIIGRNPDGVDDSVAATLLIVRGLQRYVTVAGAEGLTESERDAVRAGLSYLLGEQERPSTTIWSTPLWRSALRKLSREGEGT